MRRFTTPTQVAGLRLALVFGLGAACTLPGAAQPTLPPPTETPTATATVLPTDTPVPTATVPPTETPVPTRTFTPSPTPTPDWPVSLSDDFTEPLQGWLAGEESSEFGVSTLTLAGGQYDWEIVARKGVSVSSGPDMQPLADFVLSVEADQTGGNTTGAYGLTFRQSDIRSGYFFEIVDEGYYYVGRAGPEGLTALIDWTRTPGIHRDRPNRLAVIAQGEQFAFYINDELEATAVDDRWPTGKVGVLASLYEAEDEGTFTFDNFTLREPDEPAATATLAGGAEAAAQATAQAQGLAGRVQELVDDGVLTSGEGAYRRLPDFDQSLARLNFYRPYATGYSPADFVIRADAAWESASTTADWWNSGCGFVFRSDGNNNEYVAHLGLDGQAYLTRFTEGNYNSLGSAFYGRLDTPAGEARIMLAVQGSQISFFVNDELVHKREDHGLRAGSLAYTLVSGTNKDFGTRCTMTNVELWELE